MNKMMEIIQGLPENVVGVVASGKVTGEDYDNVLIPEIMEKIEKYKKIRMLYQAGRDFSHLTYRCISGRCQSHVAHNFN